MKTTEVFLPNRMDYWENRVGKKKVQKECRSQLFRWKPVPKTVDAGVKKSVLGRRKEGAHKIFLFLEKKRPFSNHLVSRRRIEKNTSTFLPLYKSTVVSTLSNSRYFRRKKWCYTFTSRRLARFNFAPLRYILWPQLSLQFVDKDKIRLTGGIMRLLFLLLILPSLIAARTTAREREGRLCEWRFIKTLSLE